MSASTTGAAAVAAAIVGESFVPFNAAAAHLGIGSDSTAVDVAQTDLLDAGAVRLPMESGYPQRSGGVLTFRALAGAAEANFHWQEFGIFNAASGGVMLKRMLRDFGEKSAGQIWALQIQLEVR
jgi:hypothetical protein